ncbi:hypothetical protein GCM10007352_12370 [Mucilaginibacter phyllosphaerae]|nr:hypothetical protein GCM10007352_12370 [Mucilaginibacter phyllosphaerae]
MDVINQIVIHAILNKIGWPYKSIYGDKVSLTAYYVIMHSSKEKIRKYIKQLAFATELGEADCQHLANMIDRLLKYRGKKQIYGNAIRGLKINGQLQYYIYPIVNFKDVNKRRKKIGLKHTIEEYAEINNAILNYGDDISIRLTRYLCD